MVLNTFACDQAWLILSNALTNLILNANESAVQFYNAYFLSLLKLCNALSNINRHNNY